MDQRRGQVVVEAAIAMPLSVALILGVLQLSLIEQARLFTDYAAAQAARAGAVWNGSNERMRDAALFSLLPTLGRTDDARSLEDTWSTARRLDEQWSLKLAPLADVPDAFRQAALLGMVRVDTVNPAAYPRLDALWMNGSSAHWEELDFDGADDFPESPQLDRHFHRFQQPRQRDPDSDLLRRATLLTIRIRYLYELKIPLANYVVFTAWLAANSARTLSGPLWATGTRSGNAVTPTGGVDDSIATGRGISNARGLPTLASAEIAELWNVARGDGAFGGSPRFFLPLSSTYAIRMQSSFYRKWIMHESPSWSP